MNKKSNNFQLTNENSKLQADINTNLYYYTSKDDCK